MKFAKGAESWLAAGFVCIVVSFLVLVMFDVGLVWRNVFMFLVVLFCLVEVFFVVFFRDPDRIIGAGLVAAADGVIRRVEKVVDDDVGDGVCISTFMNIYHVHVNRMPVDGTIVEVVHRPGGHVPAFRKESERNEQMIILVNTESGLIKIVQIAGTLARRIVCYGTPGCNLKKGVRLGLIRLGSRVDVIIPKEIIYEILVRKGDRVRAGETQICRVQ